MEDLTERELFLSLDNVEVDGFNVDLHNDYKCESVNFDNETEVLTLLFNGERTILLQFEQASIAKLKLVMTDVLELGTLDLCYRGRFLEKGVLKEKTAQGAYYYYISFWEGTMLEVFATRMLMINKS